MTHIFVITNHKGGVGKSTTATNVAFGLVQVLRQAGLERHQVLLIDTDSQGHASLVTTGRTDFGRDNSLYTVLLAERREAVGVLAHCVVPSIWDEDLHVLPASPLLEAAERELIGVAGAPYRIKHPLERIIHQYAAVVIDTRPSFSLMTEMGLLAATDAIVPVEPRYLETIGLQSVVNKINDVREGWQHYALHIEGILVTKLDTRIKGHMQLLEELREEPVLGKLLCGVIPANEAVAYAHREHQSVFEYDPNCAASRAYAQVVGTLARKVMAGGAQ